MAIYYYSPGNRAELHPESVSLIGATRRDIESERHRLINAGMNAVNRGEAHTKEITGQLSRADHKRLPVELVGRLIDPDYYEAQVTNAQGLAMYAPRTEGQPNFALLSEEVEDVEELIAEERMDRQTFLNLVVRDAITHDALQHEFYETGGFHPELRARAHDTFGYYVGEQFVPVVTVLNREHPVRQLIEQRQAEQT